MPLRVVAIECKSGSVTTFERTVQAICPHRRQRLHCIQPEVLYEEQHMISLYFVLGLGASHVTPCPLGSSVLTFTLWFLFQDLGPP